MQMPRRKPRVVGDVVVAGLYSGERIFIEEMNDSIGHRIDMAWRAGYRLRQHAAVTVEHAGGEVAGLAHRRAERRADHHLRLFLYHRDQAVPHDLRVDLAERGVRTGDHGHLSRRTSSI